MSGLSYVGRTPDTDTSTITKKWVEDAIDVAADEIITTIGAPLWTGTAAEYAAVDPKDPDVVYVVLP